MRNIIDAFEQYAKLSKKIPSEVIANLSSIEDPSKLSDVAASHLNVKLEEKQNILQIVNVGERLEKIYSLLISEVEILEVEERIKRRVKKQMEKTQKDYYLNEQMRAIQKEMGEEDSFKTEIRELEKRLKERNCPRRPRRRSGTRSRN